MSSPRLVRRDRFALLTRRCTQRQFLLRPCEVMNAIFLYCLAVAAQKFGIVVLLTTVMSDHHHTVIFDPTGRVIEFIEYLHRFVAKAGNVLRNRRENFWSSDEPSIVYLETLEDVFDALAYVATNPVKDGLVERVADWPGVNTLEQFLSGEEITTPRPEIFFRRRGRMPEQATLRMQVPASMGDAAALRAALRQRVDSIESEFARARRETSKSVVGRMRVLAEPATTCARTPEARRRLRPRLAAKDPTIRRAALAVQRAFLDAYRAARERWIAGLDAVFPAGTYWLRRFGGVTVSSE